MPLLRSLRMEGCRSLGGASLSSATLSELSLAGCTSLATLDASRCPRLRTLQLDLLPGPALALAQAAAPGRYDALDSMAQSLMRQARSLPWALKCLLCISCHKVGMICSY